jgi:hypothetical protein
MFWDFRKVFSKGSVQIPNAKTYYFWHRIRTILETVINFAVMSNVGEP